MKTRTQITTFLFFFIITSAGSILTAESKNETYQLPAYNIEDISMPVPVKVIQPDVRKAQIGQEAYILFTITEKGTTRNVRQKGSAYNMNDLEVGMKQAVRGWKFEPARDKNGNPISVDVGLRFKAVEKKKNNKTYVAITFSKPEIIKAG